MSCITSSHSMDTRKNKVSKLFQNKEENIWGEISLQSNNHNGNKSGAKERHGWVNLEGKCVRNQHVSKSVSHRCLPFTSLSSSRFIVQTEQLSTRTLLQNQLKEQPSVFLLNCLSPQASSLWRTRAVYLWKQKQDFHCTRSGKMVSELLLSGSSHFQNH